MQKSGLSKQKQQFLCFFPKKNAPKKTPFLPVSRFFALVTQFFASCPLIISHLAPFLLLTPTRGDMGSGRGPKSECTPKRAILGCFCQKVAFYLVCGFKRRHGCDRLDISPPQVVPKRRRVETLTLETFQKVVFHQRRRPNWTPPTWGRSFFGNNQPPISPLRREGGLVA